MLWKTLREYQRAKAVAKLGKPGQLTEPGFDRFVQQAAEAFAAPISLLTLVDTDTMWVKACAGFNLQNLPRQDSFCSHALDSVGPLEVCDALADGRFKNLPPVTGEPYIRYYIGAPLTLASGINVGALCVIDTSSRPPVSIDQRAYLVGLARQATHALERRAHVKGNIAA